MGSQDGGISIAIVPIEDGYFAASPVTADADPVVFAAPASPNCRIEVLGIDIICTTQLTIDASAEILINLVYHDASGDADTTLLTGAAGELGDLKTIELDLNESYHLWHGSQSLDPGDSIRAPIDVSTPDTAGVGYAFVVAYRVQEWGGQ